MKRVILIALDSVGVGALPDAADFGDAGADTLGHILEYTKASLPNLFRAGAANISGVAFSSKKVDKPVFAFGKAAEKTRAKDTTSGHWEIAGVSLDVPFRTYPEGFPKDIVREFESLIGRKTLGNYVASGTEIIKELGDEHVKTGFPIIYTSADSVFQIAAHEAVIPLAELYRQCETARALLVGERAVGRIIARPFIGEPGAYSRTKNRRDYALPPPRDTILDALKSRGLDVVGIGKIEDIFCHRGMTRVDHTTNNAAGIEATLRFMREKTPRDGLIFTNLVDYDMLYGHRNDIEGYAKALEAFDQKLPELMDAMREGDLLIITADHGCDPEFPGTDHTREYVPILVSGDGVKPSDLGVRETFADIGATVYEYLTDEKWDEGTSFLRELFYERQ